MKKFYFLATLVIVLISFNPIMTYCQDIKIDWGGFVKTDIIYDTRQNFALREGHFLLWPEGEKLDVNQKDINDKPNFNIMSVQTRIFGKIKGPEILGAQTSGYIEGEFFGSAEANMNTFRLRHAYIDLNWGSTILKTGQYWNPMFVAECFPAVLSFNTGAPFQPFSRNPQIRLTQKFSDFSISLAAVSQRDFTSDGPDGKTSKYLRNAVVPELFLGFQYNTPSFLIGAGGEYKSIQPRLTTTTNNQTDEKISSMAAMGYLKFALGDFSFKAEGTYGQNLTDLMMLGGYALKSFDVNTGVEEYTPVSSLSVWGELMYGKEFEIGLFGGYSKNLGTVDDIPSMITSKYYGWIANCESMLRVSPRFAWNAGKFKTGIEIEYSSAAYGENDNTDKGKVIDAKDINNIRVLGVLFIFF